MLESLDCAARSCCCCALRDAFVRLTVPISSLIVSTRLGLDLRVLINRSLDVGAPRQFARPPPLKNPNDLVTEAA